MNNNKNNNKLIGGLIIILLIILLIIAGLAVYLNFFTAKSYSDEEQPAGNSSSSDNYQIPLGITLPADDSADQAEPKDPTIDWQVYSVPKVATTSSSSTVLFAFKYPKDLEIKRNGNYLSLESLTVTSTKIAISWEVTTSTVTDYLKNYDKISATAWEGKPSIQVVTSTDQAKFGAWPAIVREQKLLAADLSEYVIYFKTSDTVYSVGLIAPQLNQNLINFLVVFMNNFQLGQ